MHYYQFNIGDYMKSTLHLNHIEDLAYRRLLDRYYDTEKPLEADVKKLCRFVRMGSYETETQQVLEEFFQLTQKGWIHKRVQKELGAYSRKADAARANGKLGGRPKKTQSVNLANPEETGLKAKQEPITNNQEPITNSDKDIAPAKPKPRKKFAKPDLNLVFSYMKDRGIDHNTSMSEAERFIDYYESNGWKVGKNAMKDWKAAVRNWTKNINTGVQTNGQARPNQPKPSLVDRAKQHAERHFASQQGANEAYREPSVQTVANAHIDVRQQVCEPVRGDAQRHMGEVLDGDFWPADGQGS